MLEIIIALFIGMFTPNTNQDTTNPDNPQTQSFTDGTGPDTGDNAQIPPKK